MNKEKSGGLIWIIMSIVIVALIVVAIVMFKKYSDNKDEKKKKDKDDEKINVEDMVDELLFDSENEETTAQMAETMDNTQASDLTESAEVTEEINDINEDSKSTDLTEKKYKNVTYYIPSYFDKYVVTEETEKALIYYQKASYGSLYDGHLFSIVCCSDDSYKEFPNYRYIGNDGTYSYVFLYPSDVRFDMNNKAIADEYGILSEKSNSLNGYVEGDVTNNNTVSSNDEYILPTSNSQYLTKADLSHLSENQLMLARNELYARHGYIFNTPEIKSYFESKSWYYPSIPSDQWSDSCLSDVEKANIATIIEVETELGYR